MKKLKLSTRYAGVLLTALSLGAGSIWAQTAPAPTPATKAQDASANSEAVDEAITLDPFTVTTEHEGYQAIDTLAGGRVRTNLKDTTSSLSVVTKKLMTDLGIYRQEDLFIYTNNTEVSGLNGNYSGMTARGQGIPSGAAEGTRLTNPGNVNRSRGLTGVDSTRNYIPSDIPWDGFNISRVDISRGPNSFLFGTGSPSGIANVATNEATFKNKAQVEANYGSFGSTRESLDINRVLLPDELSFRLDLVNDNRLYQQEPAFNHSQRAYGAVRFDPKFLRTDSAYTKIQASFEHGKVESNNPRTLPPTDFITGYLSDATASKTGYNPWTYQAGAVDGVDASQSLWAAAGSIANQFQWANDAQLYYDAKNGTLLDAGQAGYTSPTGNGYGSHSNTWNVHSNGFYDH